MPPLDDEAVAASIGWSTTALMGVETDREVANAVSRVARVLRTGHHVSEESPSSARRWAA